MKQIQGKQSLVRDIGRFRKPRVREIGIAVYDYTLGLINPSLEPKLILDQKREEEKRRREVLLCQQSVNLSCFLTVVQFRSTLLIKNLCIVTFGAGTIGTNGKAPYSMVYW